MKEVMYTRLLLLKKQWISLLFWLFLPIIATIAILTTMETVQDDFTVPIGVVLEEETNSSDELYQSINDSSLVTVSLLSEQEAMKLLQQHQLDSVFIIKEGYEEDIHEGNRRNLLKSYYSERSFAYNPVKQMIISIVQQETGRMKAANTVMELEKQLSSSQRWSTEDIIATSRKIQAEEDLLNNEFRYQGEPVENVDSNNLLNPWIIWAFITMLTTIFLFDWVLKEQKASVGIRFPFMKWNYPSYLLMNIVVYLILLLVSDIITVSIFQWLYQEDIAILALLSFRIMITLFAFLFVSIARNVYFSYVLAISWTLILVAISGTLLPLSGMGVIGEWITFFHPLARFLSGEWSIEWLLICLVGMAIWYVRKERKYA